MIERKYKMPNPSFECSEMECEKTGIKLQILKRLNSTSCYYAIVDTDGIEKYVTLPVFEVIKKLLV